MPSVIVDLHTNLVVGLANDGAVVTAHQLLLPMPDEFSVDNATEWLYDGQGLSRDSARLLAKAQAARKERIKGEAAQLIAATDWRLERAREREAAGWATLAEVDAVLAEREAIRRSSSAAEAAVDALTDLASVRAFTWSVDVPVAAPRRLTHREFMARFESAESEAILVAAASTPSLQAWWETFRLAQFVNLDDPATRAGIQALEIASVLPAGRAAEILA